MESGLAALILSAAEPVFGQTVIDDFSAAGAATIQPRGWRASRPRRGCSAAAQAIRVFLACLAVPALAAPVLAYRPFVTEDANVAGKGALEAEISAEASRQRNGDWDIVTLLVFPIYGLTKTTEFSAETPYVVHRPADSGQEEGVGDVNLALKQVLFQETTRTPIFTLKGVVKLATGDRNDGLGSGDENYSLYAVASKTLGFFALHANLGYVWNGNAKEDLRDTLIYGAAVDYAATKRFHLVAESYGGESTDETERTWSDVMTGAYFQMTKTVVIDLALRRGLTSSSPDWGIGIGLSAAFN